METFSNAVTVVLFYLGAVNALLARFVGTCNQGDASRLFGILITAILFAAALMAMSFSTHRRGVLRAISLAFPLLAWHTIFSARLGYALLWQGASACEALEGVPYPSDGNEVFYGIAWPVVTIATWTGLLVLWLHRSSKPRSTF